MATEREDVQHAYEHVRQAVKDGDDLLGRFAGDVGRVVSRANIGIGGFTATDRNVLMRELDPVLWQYFGRTQREAASSPLYRLIERRAAITGVSESRRAWDELDSLMRASDPVRWVSIQRHLASAPLEERDELMVLYRMLFGPDVDRQRLVNSSILDPLRTWVDPDGYKLSGRVWKGGRRVRRGIDRRIRDGIRRGESAESIARAIRHYVDPEYAPIRYQKNGRIIRTAAGRQQRSATEASRTLVRTEISRVHGEGAIQRAAGVPGLLGIKWRLSGSHPEQDECDTNATQDLYGLGPGIYPPDKVPRYPNHPRDMCVLLPVHKSREQTRAEIVSKYRHIAGVE